MRKSVLKFAAIVAVIVAYAGLAWASESGIAFVNVGKVMDKSKRAQETKFKLTQAMNAEKDALEQKQKQLIALKTEIDTQAQGGLVKQEALNDKIKQFEMLKTELQIASRQAEERIQTEQREVQQSFLNEIRKIVNEIRLQKKLSLVIEYGALLSADDSFDITEEVIRAYDSAAPTRPAGPATKAPTHPAPKPAPPKK